MITLITIILIVIDITGVPAAKWQVVLFWGIGSRNQSFINYHHSTTVGSSRSTTKIFYKQIPKDMFTHHSVNQPNMYEMYWARNEPVNSYWYTNKKDRLRHILPNATATGERNHAHITSSALPSRSKLLDLCFNGESKILMRHSQFFPRSNFKLFEKLCVSWRLSSGCFFSVWEYHRQISYRDFNSLILRE